MYSIKYALFYSYSLSKNGKVFYSGSVETRSNSKFLIIFIAFYLISCCPRRMLPYSTIDVRRLTRVMKSASFWIPRARMDMKETLSRIWRSTSINLIIKFYSWLLKVDRNEVPDVRFWSWVIKNEMKPMISDPIFYPFPSTVQNSNLL